MKNIYRKHGYSHSKCMLRYHIVFSTKYRKKCLEPIKDKVIDAFRYCESKSDFKILNINTDKDHIHLYLENPPTLSIGQTVNRLKAITTNYLWDRFDYYLKHFYWKKKRMLWTHGYYAASVGQVSESTVWRYIDNQGSKN